MSKFYCLTFKLFIMRGKFTLWLVSIFMMATLSTNAQITAEWIDPLPQGNDFDDVEFVNETLGIAVTYGGAIVKSTDGGETWMSIPAITAEDLTDIFWIDETNVVVGGNNGTLLMSTDAGSTWMKKYMGMTLNIRKVFFTSATVGYVVGNSSYIFKTMDGGATWEAVYQNSFMDFNTGETATPNIQSVFFLDADKGWICGDKNTVAFTTDGGATWMASITPAALALSLPSYYDVYFTDATNGAIVGDAGVALTSSDGGMSWIPALAAPGPATYSIVSGPDAIWATTGDANGVVYSSADNGANWDATVTTGPFIYVSGRTVADDADSLIIDGYSDGTIADISFAGSKMVAVGWAGSSATSMDNGATWSPQAINQSTFNFGGWIQAMGYSTDKMTVYAGTSGVGNYLFSGNTKFPELYKSVDGGNTWEIKDSFTGLLGSGNPPTAIMVNPNDANHLVIAARKRQKWSRDGGETWYNTQDLYVNEDSVNINGGSGIGNTDHFGGQWVDDSTVVVVSSGLIQISTDTAKTWRVIWDKAVDTVGFVMSGYAGGDVIISNCKFVDRYTGYISARAVSAMKTIDGGETWISMTEALQAACPFGDRNNMGAVDVDPTNPLSVAMVYNNRGVAVSDDGGESFIYTQLGGTYSCNDVTYIAPGVLWTTGKAPAVSFDNGKTWQYRAVNGISNLKQTDNAYIVNETTLVESGAVSSKRNGSSIVKYTIPSGGFSMATEQATAVNFTNMGVDTTQFTVNWTRGNGDACAAFIRMYNAGDSVPSLDVFKDYMADPMWGAGERSNNGWYCIYNGTGSSVDVSGLPMNSSYTVFVTEYKTGNIYNLANADGNAAHSPEFTVGINKVSAFEGFGVYPNPSTGLVTVSVRAEKAGMGSFRILNLTGQVVESKTYKINNGLNHYQFDLKDLSAGVYFIEAVKGDKRNVSRLVVK